MTLLRIVCLSSLLGSVAVCLIVTFFIFTTCYVREFAQSPANWDIAYFSAIMFLQMYMPFAPILGLIIGGLAGWAWHSERQKLNK